MRLRQIRSTAAQQSAISLLTEKDLADMKTPHKVTSKEVGMVRIYMRPREMHRPADHGRIRAAFTARPLYKELVLQAKQAGLMNATAHHTHFGFSNHGPVQELTPEIGNPELTLCVELIGPRDKLETFCEEHGALLKGKVIVYKHLEHWHVSASSVGKASLVETDVKDPAELMNER
jgi:PII-like signaling protein